MPEPLDPLLGAASEADTPHDGQPPLPGSDRPEWLLPVLAIGFGTLIAWLVIFGQNETSSVATSSDDLAAEVVGPVETTGTPSRATVEADASADDDGATPPSGGTAAPDVPIDSENAEPGVVDPIADAAAEEAAGSTLVVDTDLDLPAPGTIRVGDSEFPILRSCVGLQPLAPASTDDLVSAHLFSPDGEREQIVERWITADGIGGVRVDGSGAAGVRQIDVQDGPNGAFVATLEQPDGSVVDVAVAPAESDGGCRDVVVTNEPGQFAFPYTRAVLASCVSGDPAAGGRVVAILTEGGRIIADTNASGTAQIRLRTMETLLGPALDLTDDAGEVFVDGTRLGFSGLVSDEESSLDLTFDVDVAGARPCTDDDG